MTSAIEAKKLTKFYPKIKSYKDLLIHPFKKQYIPAIRNLDVHIEKGTFWGLLGPNGAGKTTLLKIFSTLVLPTSGEAIVNGYNVVSDGENVRKSIGLVVNEERSFYWRLTGRQNLEFFAALNNLSSYERDRRIRQVLEQTELSNQADNMFKDYSTGMKQRLAIARGLLCDPAIVFLDEPTRSLDPQSAKHLRTFIKEEIVGANKKTALLATHNLQEAEDLCTHIAVIKQGIIQAQGTITEIKSQLGADKTYVLKLSVTSSFTDVASLPGVEKIVMLSDTPRIFQLVSGDISQVIRAVSARGGNIEECIRQRSSLEDAFTQLLEGESPPGSIHES